MKIKHKDPIIPPEEGTDPFENCKLGRKPYAEVLTSIVESYADGFVLAINNPWGEGKSTFVKMWRQHLINDKFQTLYFNAWENDFQENVLITLLAELEVLKDSVDEKNFKKVLEKATPLIKNVGLGLLKGLSKKAGLEEVVQAMIDGTIDATLDGLENEIESYTKRKKGIEEFKKSLKAYVETVDKDKPVVFFIDELDRCRPNYAVKVLEQIKHLFAVPGIVFVLSIDKVQLGHAVRGVYGSDLIDANEYLRRFIDIEFALPKSSTSDVVKHFYEYFDFESYFSNSDRRRNDFASERDDFIKFSELLFKTEGIALREIEKIFVHARLSLRTHPHQSYVFPGMLLFLIYIKSNNSNFFNAILAKKHTTQDLIIELEKMFPSSIISDVERNVVILMLIQMALSYNDYYFQENRFNNKIYVEPQRGDYQLTITINLDNSDNKEQSNRMLKHFDSMFGFQTADFNYIIKKIQLLDNLIT
ncbi:KAP family P-loop NTPase fold protein [Pseudotamlana agarivorans]|uniref:KAP family P-loop NTPase fold protein n=1 Tax=Pseudotamlana agarivorans TaxID=481183 RepID=UPI00083469BB|nr:P-loop NTPase fold protein [Tamlana agarivorans]